MSPAEQPSAGAAAGEHSGRIWFVDTASLLTMAVDTAIEAEVLAEIGSDTVVIIDIVVDELGLQATNPQTAALAETAKARLPVAWQPLQTARYVTLEDITNVQDRVADGRVLAHDKQHWAESVIIALCERSRTDIHKVLLSEDYEARRVAHSVNRLTAFSTHRILYERVQAGQLDAEVAATLSDKIQAAGRGHEVTGDDFRFHTPRKLGSRSTLIAEPIEGGGLAVPPGQYARLFPAHANRGFQTVDNGCHAPSHSDFVAAAGDERTTVIDRGDANRSPPAQTSSSAASCVIELSGMWSVLSVTA